MNKKLITIVSVLVVLGVLGVFFAYPKFFGDEKKVGEISNSGEDEKVYTNMELGLSFKYPNSYHLEERSEGEPGRLHLALILTEDTEENRDVREGRSPGREGPVSVSIDVYRDELESPSLIEWLKETPASNFNLSDGSFSNTTLYKKEAIRYKYDGLYQAEVVATQNRNYILAVTVNYLTLNDEIRAIFNSVLSSMEFN